MRRKHVLIIVIIFVCFCLVKLLTTATAVFALVNAAENTIISVGSRADLSTMSLAVDRTVQAYDTMIGELVPVVPLMRLGGAEGCAVANFIEVGRGIQPLIQDIKQLVPSLYEILSMQGSINGIPVATLSLGLAHIDRERHRTELQLLRAALPDCGGEGRFAQLWVRTDRTLELFDMVLEVPFEKIIAESAHWLIVLNNTDEIRGTGGFMTSLLDVRVENGRLMIALSNIYEVDNADLYYYHPIPPRPFTQFMGIPRWLFRDTNWSPDYPTAASLAVQIYRLNKGETVSGIVTVNMSALPTLFEFFPNIQLNDAVITSENSLDLIREAWNLDAAALNSNAGERKNFILTVATEIMTAMFKQIDAPDWLKIGDAIQAMMERRDVMVYATDPELQSIFVGNGWSGTMHVSSSDFLMLVDSNLGYNKVNGRIEQTFDYHVVLSEVPQAALMVRYANTNVQQVDCDVIHENWLQTPIPDSRTTTYNDRMNGCYWNYVRAFVPAGSSLLDFAATDLAPGSFIFNDQGYQAQVDAWREGEHDGFGLMTLTAPGQTSIVTLTYDLPPRVIGINNNLNERFYTLLLQRQAGARAIEGMIRITLPTGARLITSNPPPMQQEGQTLVFPITLLHDVTLAVTYQP